MNLKELKEKCTLLCEHKQPAFIVKDYNNISTLFSDKPNVCILFTDNKGKYYLFKRITEATVNIYYNYNDAIKRYIDFIDNTCNK